MKRDNTKISILKGIGIILVVLGHSAIKQPNGYQLFHTVIYTFHMPLFLIASGYFFKEQYLNEKKLFLKKKVKGLYLPFLKFSLAFLLLHNIFYTLGILNSDYGYNGMGSEAYSMRQVCFYALDICIRMEHYEGYHLGAYWFMRALFLGSIFLCLCSSILNKILKNACKSIIMVSLLFFILSLIKASCGFNIPLWPQGGGRDLLSVSFIGIGYIWGQTKLKLKLNNRLVVFFSLIVLIVCIIIYPGKMQVGSTVYDCISLLFSGTCGFVVVYNFSEWFNRYNNNIKKLLIYIGNNSFYILTFHFLMFKPISYLKTVYYGLDWHMIGYHPVVDEFNNWWWIIAYCVSGVGLSLLLGYSFQKMNYLIQSKMNGCISHYS